MTLSEIQRHAVMNLWKVSQCAVDVVTKGFCVSVPNLRKSLTKKFPEFVPFKVAKQSFDGDDLPQNCSLATLDSRCA